MQITSRIKNKLKRTFIDLIFLLHAEKLIIKRKKINVIIMYHGIDLNENKKFNSRFIGVKNFKKQILFFKKHTNIISLQDFLNKKFNPNKSNIAITFDDGFLNNYKYAFPILEKYEIPSTIYVTSLNQTKYDIIWPDFVDLASYHSSSSIKIDNVEFVKNSFGKYYSNELSLTLNEKIKKEGDFRYKEKVFVAFNDLNLNFKSNEKYFDNWQLMNDDQIKEIDKSKFVKIESHAYWHNNLGNIPIKEAIIELKKSKEYLENLLHREINELAYPDGSYTRELITEAENIGYKYQLAADGYNYNEDILDKRIHDRTGLYPSVSWCNQLIELYK